MADIEFLYDFASPNAYLVHRVIPLLSAKHGVRFHYSPVLLGGTFKLTNNIRPQLAYAAVKGKWEYEMLEFERFRDRYAIPFRFNPNFPLNSVLLMRAALAAEDEGVTAAYTEAVFHAVWQEGLKMDEPAIIAAALAAAGLPAERLLARAQQQEIKDALRVRTEAAVARGVFGLPSFFVGLEMFYGKERLEQVVEAALRQA